MDLLLYGSREFGQLIRVLGEECGHGFAGFIDDFSTGKDILGSLDECRRRFPPSPKRGVVLAMGYADLKARWEAYQRVKAAGFQCPALIHPRARVSPKAKVGAGALVMARADVDAFSTIGEASVLWPGALVSHNSEIGPNCFLSPGCCVCGFTQVGSSTFIGAGAIVVDHRNVPEGNFIKAGAVF